MQPRGHRDHAPPLLVSPLYQRYKEYKADDSRELRQTRPALREQWPSANQDRRAARLRAVAFAAGRFGWQPCGEPTDRPHQPTADRGSLDRIQGRNWPSAAPLASHRQFGLPILLRQTPQKPPNGLPQFWRRPTWQTRPLAPSANK